MSVESEILRIQHNIADAYTKVAGKGGEVPLQPNSRNLAESIETIPSSSDLIAGNGLSKDGNTLNVDLPTKAVSRAEYEAMTETERQAETVYLVDEPAWEAVPMTIQEYDTEDGWHVRKWSGGYVEMHHSSTINPSFENFTLGPFYYSEIMPQDAPDVLLKYSDIFVIEEIIEGTGDYWLLKQKDGLSILGTNKSNLVLSIGRTITGRWK